MTKADLSQLKVEVKWHDDMWQEIKDNALFTIHKENGKYPTSDWKKRIIMAEHSPIRSGHLIINVYNVPSFVITHFVRHHEGFQPFVASFREDRCKYDEVPNRNTLQNMRFDGNFQSFINVSRKRHCFCASYETREVWKAIMSAVKEYEPELEDRCVKECVYRNGLCPEMYTCKYNKSEEFKKELRAYIRGFEEQICDYTNISRGDIG